MTGEQPISNEDGTIWVSFNGEIYNFEELLKDLAARGRVFLTRTDTDLIVHASGILDAGYCREILRQHSERESDQSGLIWDLAIFLLWRKQIGCSPCATS